MKAFYDNDIDDELDFQETDAKKTKGKIIALLMEWGTNISHCPQNVKNELRLLIHQLASVDPEELDSIYGVCFQLGIVRKESDETEESLPVEPRD